ASHDLIIAANVLHNAATLPGVLRNLSRLLRPGGVLLLREIVERKPLFDLVFGALAPAVEDAVERGGLFADASTWCRAANQAGFAATAVFPEEGMAAAAMGEAVILARMPGALADAPPEPAQAGAAPLWQGHAPYAALAEAGAKL